MKNSVSGQIGFPHVIRHVHAIGNGNHANWIMGHCSRLERVKDWEVEARKANYHARLLAKECAVSDRQLRRYFLHRFGISTQDWINKLRLTKSCQLLLAGKLVKEIAFDLGYKHPSRFCEAFKREYGYTPTSSFTHVNGQMTVGRNKCPPIVTQHSLLKQIHNIA